MTTEYPADGPSTSRSTVKANDLLIGDDVVAHRSVPNFLRYKDLLDKNKF